VHLALYLHQSTQENGLKVRQKFSTWHFVRSFGLFSARRGGNFPTILPWIYNRRAPWTASGAMLSDDGSLLLNIRVKCSLFAPKLAHSSSKLPLPTKYVCRFRHQNIVMYTQQRP